MKTVAGWKPDSGDCLILRIILNVPSATKKTLISALAPGMALELSKESRGTTRCALRGYECASERLLPFIRRDGLGWRHPWYAVICA